MASVDTAIVYAALIGFGLGSVPFGLVLTRLAGLGDIRKIGSGNIGATNVLRTGNKFLAFLTVVCDSGKGAAAAVLSAYLWGADAGLVAGFAAVVGHNFPVWLKFKGGKGFATTLGVLLVSAWPVGVAACAVWLVVAGTFRFSSLAALASLAASPAVAYWMKLEHVAIMAAALAVLGFVRHHQNITRLLRGEESRIGAKKSEKSEKDPEGEAP